MLAAAAAAVPGAARHGSQLDAVCVEPPVTAVAQQHHILAAAVVAHLCEGRGVRQLSARNGTASTLTRLADGVVIWQAAIGQHHGAECIRMRHRHLALRRVRTRRDAHAALRTRVL